MPTIELDFNSDTEINVHTHTDEAALPLVVADARKWLDEADMQSVTFEVKQVFGPAGGASVIAFTAPDDATMRRLVERYDAGNGDVDYLLEELVVP